MAIDWFNPPPLPWQPDTRQSIAPGLSPSLPTAPTTIRDDATIAAPSSKLPDVPKTPKEKKKAAEDKKIKACYEAGGKWDAVNLKCVFPKAEITEGEEAEVSPALTPAGTLETFGDVDTGRTTGIVTPGGETFLGDISQDELSNIAEIEAQKAAIPENIAPVGTAAAIQKEAIKKLNLASQVGKIDFATAMELDELGINWKEAFLAGTSSIVPSALTYGGTAAAAGAVATAPAGGAGAVPAGAIGAAVGVIKGFYSGVSSNIKAQKGDLISGKRTELTARQKAMKNYISAANANSADADEFLQAYIMEKSLIRQDYNSLNKEANEAGTLFGGQDGTAQIIAYDVYFESVEPSLDLRMEQAILKPDPTRAYLSTEDI